MPIVKSASSAGAIGGYRHAKSRFKIPHLRWWILGLLFVVTILNYLNRQTLSILAPILTDEFHLSNQGYAFIVNAFLISYTLIQPVSGFFVDWIGTRWGFTLMFIWWSAATLLHRWARGVRSLACFRFLLGVGQAGNWPGATKAIAEWFPNRERAAAMGIFNAGSSTGALLAPPLIALVALRFGWRKAFVIVSTGGLFWVVLWLILYRKPEQHPAIHEDELRLITNDPDRLSPTNQRKISWTELLRYREAWGLVLTRVITDPVWWFYIFWWRQYLKHERGFTMAMIGLFAWIPFLSADLGCIVGGWFSDFLIRRGSSLDRSRKITLIASSLLTVTPLLLFCVHTSFMTVVAITIATFGVQSYGTLVLTVPADLFPSDVVASVSGISGFGAGLGGVVFTYLIGFLLDHFSYGPAFVLVALLSPLGYVVFRTFVPCVQGLPDHASAGFSRSYEASQ
jgi:ACS family hexuronate transporter-like MFS transporter